jgi:hypothetical protein
LPQIKQFKLVGVAVTKLRRLQVDTPDPVALPVKKRNEMLTDEPSCPGYQDPHRISQKFSPMKDRKSVSTSRLSDSSHKGNSFSPTDSATAF